MKRFFLLLALFIAVAVKGSNFIVGNIEVVVHRGANYLAPENTLPSAYIAIAHGATWVEIDVRKSKDGVLYNLHDATIDRTTNGCGLLVEKTSDEIDRLDAGSWFGEKFANIHIPRVAEMLDSLKGKANVFFDVKSGTPIGDLVKLVREKGFSDNSFFWFSDTAMLKKFVRLAPEMKVKANVSDIAGIKNWMKMCKPSYIEISPEKITDELRIFCQNHGIKIMAAVQGADEAAYCKAIAMKPDLVNLDRPELFQQVMAEIQKEARRQ